MNALAYRPFTDLSPEERAEAMRTAWEGITAAVRAAGDVIARWLDAIKPVMDAILRLMAAHRAEVRRVHTAYRRRHRARW